MQPLTVGISLLALPDSHVWSSGINQNVAFLVQLLRQLPQVGQVYLLNGGSADSLPPNLDFGDLNVQLVRPETVTHEVDVVIEMGAQLPAPWIARVRALGVKVVLFVVGSTYTAAIENAVLGKVGGGVVDHDIDEVWTLEEYRRSSVPALQTLLRVPVRVMPHLWSPHFLERQAKSVAELGEFGFDAARAQAADGWNLGIFEPNISVVKCCFTPMLLCEAAYRERPEAVQMMRVMNTVHMKEHLTFNRFATVLDLTRDSRASYEPRIAFAEAMLRFKLDAVVSHQWENEQNYLYYDALYGGYPLVHNSPWLHARGQGIYYPRFAAREGAQALLAAWAQEPGHWQDYRASAQTFLKQLAPEAPTNLAEFAPLVTRTRPRASTSTSTHTEMTA